MGERTGDLEGAEEEMVTDGVALVPINLENKKDMAAAGRKGKNKVVYMILVSIKGGWQAICAAWKEEGRMLETRRRGRQQMTTPDKGRRMLRFEQ